MCVCVCVCVCVCFICENLILKQVDGTHLFAELNDFGYLFQTIIILVHINS